MSYSNEEYANILQKIYTANVKRINDDENVDYVKVALLEAEQIWLNVQILIRSSYYEKMTDDQRINLIQKDFKEFYKNFPIVSRYMICLGQYKMKAFKRMLLKTDDSQSNDSDLEKNNKSRNEQKWIERQADYVRFLWEEYQTEGFEKKDSDKIWQHTYDTLTKEFKEFKELHEKMELKVKEDALKHKKEILYEMSERIVSGKQKLSDEDSKSLLIKLQDKLFKQRFKKLMISLIKDIRPIDPIIEGVGYNTYAKNTYDEELQQSHYKKTYKKMDINKILA